MSGETSEGQSPSGGGPGSEGQSPSGGGLGKVKRYVLIGFGALFFLGMIQAALESPEEEAARQARMEDQEKARAADVKATARTQQREDVKAAKAAAPAPAPAPAAPKGPPAKFPEIVKKFMKLNELKQEAFAENFAGTVLSGKGKVFEVEKCGLLDDSERWGSDCYKVVLDSGSPRVALYFGDEDKSMIAELEKGKKFSFKDCTAISIKDWGFWSTATCDIPPQGSASATKAPEAAPEAAPETGRPAKFPEIVKKFMKLNELKQEAFAESFAGTILSGKGKVFEVEKCGLLDDSERWGSDCYKVVLDSGSPRVALYFGDEDKSMIAELDKGKIFPFKDCKAISIKDWGFWSTATCDMPPQGSASAAAAPEPDQGPGPPAKFPAVVKKFMKLNEIKQEAFAARFSGTMLSGKGKVFEVEKCGLLDDSQKWGGDCYKVVLDSGSPRVALYFGGKDKSMIAELDKGKKFSFKDCTGISIKDWGFWSTATCDMP